MTEGTPKKRGRPREFDTVLALSAATQTFLRYGYAGTSVEELTRSMQLNKPSLYAAFGDKRELYLTVVNQRIRELSVRFRAAFDKGRDLEDALRGLFYDAVDAYLDENMPPGCLLVSAGSAEAVTDSVIQEFARAFFESSDHALGEWVREKLNGKGTASAAAVGKMANGVIHEIALRSRLGESRSKLRDLSKIAAKMLARATEE